MNKTESHVVYQPNQKGLKFYGDKRRALKVLDSTMKRLSEKGIPYDKAHVPQSDQFLPSNLVKGSREHAIFLFQACLWMRGGVESDTATSFLKILHEERPHLFVPENFLDCGSRKTWKQIWGVMRSLKRFNLGQRAEENARGWVYNLRKLARFWDGDPRKLMDDKPKFNVLAKRIIDRKRRQTKGRFFSNEDSAFGFMYFREKMVAMIAYFLMDAGLVEMFYTAAPIDFHFLRYFTNNLIFRVKGMSVEEMIGIDFMRPSVSKIAREITEWYCRKRRVSPVALCDAVWLLSRTLCRENPGNSGYVLDGKRKILSHKRKKEILNTDYLFSMNGNNRASDVVTGVLPSKSNDALGRKRYRGFRFNSEELQKPKLVKRFNKSCAVCPANKFCKFNISSGAYYVGGMLLPERLRVIPKNHQTDFLDHSEFYGSMGNLPDPTIRYSKITLDIPE